MSKHQPVNVTVERTIPASPEALYDIVTDVSRIGEMSPECRSAEWVGKHASPQVGARFKGSNELGKSKWSTKPTVTAAERGQVFEFKVPMGFGPTWRYEFHQVEGGTRVVESMRQDKASPWFIRRAQVKAGVTDRAANVTDAMTTTLANLDRLATA
ncbi:MAG: SRPBCC family protein [Ilumatobacter sp.]